MGFGGINKGQDDNKRGQIWGSTELECETKMGPVLGYGLGNLQAAVDDELGGFKTALSHFHCASS